MLEDERAYQTYHKTLNLSGERAQIAIGIWASVAIPLDQHTALT